MIDKVELPDGIRALAARQDGVVTTAQAIRLGVPRSRIRRLAAHGTWRHLARGAYWVVPRGEPRLRTRVRAAQLSCGGRSVAVGPTAARLHGLEGADSGDAVVHLASRGHREPPDGIVHHRLGRRETTSLGTLAVTTVAQTVADVLLSKKRMPAVSVLDSALHQRLLPGGLGHVEALLFGRTGVDRALRRMAEADGRAESPLETRNRLVCADHGMPPETLQWPLSDPRSGVRYRLDAGYPSRWVGVEADGRSVHDRQDALHADRARQNDLLSAYPELVILRFTWADSVRPERFLAALRRALTGRPRRPP
jgi:hypothetical protein